MVHIVAQHGADVMIKDHNTLIQLGADINCTDNEGETTLYCITNGPY